MFAGNLNGVCRHIRLLPLRIPPRKTYGAVFGVQVMDPNFIYDSDSKQEM